MRLLLAEDDKPVASFIQKGLQAEAYAVDQAADGNEAELLMDQFDYDGVILDLTLPRLDGLEVLRHIRATRPKVPVLILTARSRVEDRVKGLDLGADDYLGKPFAFSELAARLRALLRRSSRPPEMVLQVEDLEMNRVERSVRRDGRAISLSPKEFALLEYLMRNAGHTLTRAMIIDHVWNLSFDTLTNIVDVYINYLRKKVDAHSSRKLIHTVRGVGYCLGGEEAP